MSIIVTYTGRRVNIMQPDASVVCIEDIAHALACVNRYNGHASAPYSVAQHSVVLSRYVQASGITLATHPDPRMAALWALLHDAAEAYLGDVVRPLKQLAVMEPLRLIEEAWQMEIALAMGLFPLHEPEEISLLDQRLLLDEWPALMPGKTDWFSDLEPLGVWDEDGYCLLGWAPSGVWEWGIAEAAFLKQWRALGGEAKVARKQEGGKAA